MYKAILSRRRITELPDYYSCISDLLENQSVRQLGGFTHHKVTTRLQHSINVSYYNYLLCRRLHLDSCSAARAGLLHDLFLYDRKEHEPVDGEGGHYSGHPKVAFFNAVELFSINEKESDMIVNHMWPLSPHLPRCPEAWVIQFVDKFCAMSELLTAAVFMSRHTFRIIKAFSLMLLIRLSVLF